MATGASVATVKYYRREGLLPAGVKTSPNQAQYSAEHVRRVRLIRALLETGGLSVAAAGRVLGRVDDEGAPVEHVFAEAQHAMGDASASNAVPSAGSVERIGELAARAGWAVSDANPGIVQAALALDGFAAIDATVSDAYLSGYAAAAAVAAGADMDLLDSRDDRAGVAELMVVGTVLGDPLFAGLRRLAQEQASSRARPGGAGSRAVDA